MWAVRRKIDVSELPKWRTVIRFQFNDDPRPKNSRYWLVYEPGALLPELCIYDPSLDIDLFVETTTISLGAIMVDDPV